MMDNLYDINKGYLELMESIEENEGVLSPEILSQMENNSEDFETKVGNYIKVIRKFEADEKAIKDEEKRLRSLKKTKSNSVKNLKKFLHTSLQLRDIDKMDLGTSKLSFRKSKKVEITGDVPIEYSRTIYKPDKKKIKEAIESGIEVKNAKITKNQNLQIK